MPDVWMPGAVVRPGRNAGYAAGRNRCDLAIVHYTVGRDSTGIGDQGYFHILFPKEGPPIQFAEIDAVTWHAGGSSAMPNANQLGPGAEWERMPTGNYIRPGLQEAEPLTSDQVTWGGRWIDFCAEWGIPKEHYPGPQFGAAGFLGQINHGDIDKDRSDGVTPEEWAAMTSGDDLTPEEHNALFEVLEWIKGGQYIPPAKSVAGRVANIDGILTGGDSNQFPPMEKRIVKNVNDHTDEAVGDGGGGGAAASSFSGTFTATTE